MSLEENPVWEDQVCRKKILFSRKWKDALSLCFRTEMLLCILNLS